MERKTNRRKQHHFIATGNVTFEKDGKDHTEPVQYKTTAHSIRTYCERLGKPSEVVIPGLIKEYFKDLFQAENIKLHDFVGKFT